MPVRLLSSSVLRWPNRDEVHESVVSWAKQLLEMRDDIVMVGYFGSYARNDWGPGSDLDLIVVVDDSPLPFGKRSLGTSILDLPVGVDLLVYTLGEFRDTGKQQTTFPDHLAREVVWVSRRGSGCH